MQTAELLSAVHDAVYAEKTAIRHRLGALAEAASVPVTDAERVSEAPGAFSYTFEVATELLIPDGTRVVLDVDGRLTAGEVTEHETALGILTCELRDDLGDHIPRGRLQFEPTALLDMLEARIGKLIAGAAQAQLGGLSAPSSSRVERAFRFLTGTPEPLEAKAAPVEGGSPIQQAAIAHILRNGVSYLWGPPGTGKTETLAHLVNALTSSGERLVLTAHTNIATDNALKRALDGLRKARAFRRGDVVRVGPVGEVLFGSGVELDVLADERARQDPELVRRIEAVCAAVPDQARRSRWTLGQRLRAAVEGANEAVRKASPQLGPELAALQEAWILIEKAVIERALVVGTTLTRLFTSPLLSDLVAETVIIDEASMASRCSAFIAAAAASRRVVAIGDFRQLPPIVQSDHPAARTWLGTNVFESAGCADPSRDHPLRTMLDEQWRMHPKIATVVSRHFYADRLKTAAERGRAAHEGPALVLLDTSRTAAKAERAQAGSKKNDVHARLVARIAAAARAKTAVIAPYRAQVRAIREETKALSPHKVKSGAVEVFTVHRFQGREAPIVLFDLTEATGTQSRFLDARHNRDADNLINVALSRAQHLLVLVAHVEHLRRLQGRSSPLLRLMADFRRLGRELYADDPAQLGELLQLVAEAGRA